MNESKVQSEMPELHESRRWRYGDFFYIAPDCSSKWSGFGQGTANYWRGSATYYNLARDGRHGTGTHSDGGHAASRSKSRRWRDGVRHWDAVNGDGVRLQSDAEIVTHCNDLFDVMVSRKQGRSGCR
jgi:hypothetical protein